MLPGNSMDCVAQTWVQPLHLTFYQFAFLFDYQGSGC